MQPHNLQHIGEPLIEQEVQPSPGDYGSSSEKGTGPDGYIGLLYKCCKNIVKTLMNALEDIFNLRGRHWNLQRASPATPPTSNLDSGGQKISSSRPLLDPQICCRTFPVLLFLKKYTDLKAAHLIN